MTKLMNFFLSPDVFGLKGVRIWNPEAIRAGESLRLSCDYDLDGVPLYSIKWYFGDQEFYRFVPKESPPTRVFPLSGTTSVDVSIYFYYIKIYTNTTNFANAEIKFVLFNIFIYS